MSDTLQCWACPLQEAINDGSNVVCRYSRSVVKNQNSDCELANSESFKMFVEAAALTIAEAASILATLEQAQKECNDV